ncbi:hypothetical protein JHK85_055819 [Glycine max]|nr:hypothetical protein JHK85_055819 [Glycine max]
MESIHENISCPILYILLYTAYEETSAFKSKCFQATSDPNCILLCALAHCRRLNLLASQLSHSQSQLWTQSLSDSHFADSRFLGFICVWLCLRIRCLTDALVEEEVGGNSVADIFKQHGETFFHNKENSEAMISIDMPAGPSEVLVIADKHAIPSHVAADLLSQV